jgi:tetratricopeptide (TPR) repeat protein
MRGHVLRAASLAAGVLFGGHALAQAPGESPGEPSGQSDESTGGKVPVPSLPEPFSRFDFNRLWEVPGGKKAEEGLGSREGRKPGGPAAAAADAPAGGAAQKSGVAEAGQLRQALAPKPTPEAVRTQMLDTLFERLRKASGPEDARRVAETIERVFLQSYSGTANLLMQRAMACVQAGQYELALSLFDKLVALEPDWAEAWNQRATTRFLTGDTDGAMADIGRVMKLEPRHFGALAGMGMILQGAGLDKGALEIFNKALAIYPLEPDIRKLAEKLTLEVEGQDI